MSLPRSTLIVAATVAALGLAGCSGGAGPGVALPGGEGVASSGAAGPVDKARRDALHAELMGLESRFLYHKPEEGHAIRNSGTATYNGVAAMGLRGRSNQGGHAPVSNMPEIIADMAVNVDYVTDEFNASMWDFHALNGRKAEGSVQIGGTKDKGSLDAFGTGTLSWGDHEQILDVTMDGVILADEVGLRGDLDVISVIDGVGSQMDGFFILVDDKLPVPRR